MRRILLLGVVGLLMLLVAMPAGAATTKAFSADFREFFGKAPAHPCANAFTCGVGTVAGYGAATSLFEIVGFGGYDPDTGCGPTATQRTISLADGSGTLCSPAPGRSASRAVVRDSGGFVRPLLRQSRAARADLDRHRRHRCVRRRDRERHRSLPQRRRLREREPERHPDAAVRPSGRSAPRSGRSQLLLEAARGGLHQLVQVRVVVRLCAAPWARRHLRGLTRGSERAPGKPVSGRFGCGLGDGVGHGEPGSARRRRCRPRSLSLTNVTRAPSRSSSASALNSTAAQAIPASRPSEPPTRNSLGPPSIPQINHKRVTAATGVRLNWTPAFISIFGPFP